MRTLAKSLIPMLLVTALAATARAEGGYLGVTINDAEGGIQILTVRDASAAAAAGVKSGDVVQAIGETKIANLDDFQKQLAKLSAGDKITLKVKRGEANETFEVTLGKRPGESVATTTTVSSEPKAAHSGNAIPATPLIAAPVEPAPAQAPAAPAPPAKTGGSITSNVSLKAAPGGAGLGISTATAAPPRKGGFLGVTLEGGDGADNTISSVVDGGPAAKAGISNGDQIVAIDGKTVASASDISGYLATKQAGDSVEITVMRDGKRKLRTATLAAYGKIGFAAGPGNTVGGIQLSAPAEVPEKASDNEKPKTAAGGMRAKRAENANKATASKKSGGRGWLGVMLEGNDGAPIVSEPTENSPAANAGIKAGDAIVQVGDQQIESTEDLLAALDGKAGQDVAVVVKRGGATKKFGITLGDVPAEHAVAEANEPNEPMPKATPKAKMDATVKAAHESTERAIKAANEDALKAKKRVDEQVAKAREEAKMVREQAAEAREKAAKARAEIRDRVGKGAPAESTATTERSRWFFPIGKELPLRVEKKKGDIWITTGAGSQGILVPQDGSTSVTLEAKGDGVEVVVGGGQTAGEVHTFTFSPEMGKSGDGKSFFKVEIPSVGDAKVMTRHKDDDDDDDDDADDDDDDHEHGHTDHGMAHGNGVFVLGGGDIPHHEIVVEKGHDLVVPHPPVAGGGGIIINNNGGTVIIGDSAIKLRAAHGGEKRIDVLMKDGDADAKMKTLKELGYIGEKAEKKAKKAEKKKDSN